MSPIITTPEIALVTYTSSIKKLHPPDDIETKGYGDIYYECGCNKKHNINDNSVTKINSLTFMKLLVLCNNDYVSLIQIKGFTNVKIHTLFTCSATVLKKGLSKIYPEIKTNLQTHIYLNEIHKFDNYYNSNSLPKEKLIKLIYLAIIILLSFYYFIYPSPNKSKISNYLIKATACKITITSNSSVVFDQEIEKFFNDYQKKIYAKACPEQSPIITISSKNFDFFMSIIVTFLFISLNFIIWRTREYFLFLVFYFNKLLKYFNKLLKNIFRKI